jgi:hypothetical protein
MLDYSKYQTTKGQPEITSMIKPFQSVEYNVGNVIDDIGDYSVSAIFH